MSALLEWQRAMRTQLLTSQPSADCREDERLAIYRNTCVMTLVNSLQLTFPAVRLLVGDEFFEGAARQFVACDPPRSAYLNDYGASFAPFLAQFAPAAGISYLADVARLEWAVSRALHAPDELALDVARLAALDPGEAGKLRFRARADVSALRLSSPADAIWRAVLAGDETAMAGLKLNSGPVYLLVERCDDAVAVQRLEPAAGPFSAALLAGQRLDTALEAGSADPEMDFNSLLAGHLRLGRFSDFTVTTTGEGA